MHLITICDDEAKELDKEEKLLLDYKEEHPEYEFTVDRFESVTELLHIMKTEKYTPDLLLLDVYMPEKLGTTMAKELREMGNKSRIIFLTTSMDHALEAFQLNALQYLVKPVSKKELFTALDKFSCELEEQQSEYLLLKIDGTAHQILLDSIVCFEGQGKDQHLYLDDGTHFTLHMTIAGLYQMLAHYHNFVKIGAAYIVNLEHIDSLNSHNIFFDTGASIFLPRGAYQPLREQYFQYYYQDIE